MAERLSSEEFVQNLGILLDTISELSILSTILQKNDINIPTAHNAILRVVRVFEDRRAKPGIYQTEVIATVQKGSLKGIKLHKGRKCNTVIHSSQFYQCLVDNLKTHRFTTQFQI